jgi:hypothetical protein
MARGAAGHATGPAAMTFRAVAIVYEGVSVMMPKTLKYGVALACGFLALAGLSALAGGQKGGKSALTGTWNKKDGELKIEFADKDVMKIAPHGDPALIAIVCQCVAQKEGRVKAKVTGFEGKAEAQKKIQELVPVGFEFGFTWQAKGGTARLDDVKGDKVDLLKSHLEGDYEQSR